MAVQLAGLRHARESRAGAVDHNPAETAASIRAQWITIPPPRGSVFGRR
jgi:hypothetical protein